MTRARRIHHARTYSEVERASGHKVTMTVLGTGPAVQRSRNGNLCGLHPCWGRRASTSWRGTARRHRHVQTGIQLAQSCGEIRREEAGHPHGRSAQEGDCSKPNRSATARPSGEHSPRSSSRKLGLAERFGTKMANLRGAPVGTGCARGDVEIWHPSGRRLQPIERQSPMSSAIYRPI